MALALWHVSTYPGIGGRMPSYADIREHAEIQPRMELEGKLGMGGDLATIALPFRFGAIAAAVVWASWDIQLSPQPQIELNVQVTSVWNIAKSVNWMWDKLKQHYREETTTHHSIQKHFFHVFIQSKSRNISRGLVRNIQMMERMVIGWMLMDKELGY